MPRLKKIEFKRLFKRLFFFRKRKKRDFHAGADFSGKGEVSSAPPLPQNSSQGPQPHVSRLLGDQIQGNQIQDNQIQGDQIQGNQIQGNQTKGRGVFFRSLFQRERQKGFQGEKRGGFFSVFSSKYLSRKGLFSKRFSPKSFQKTLAAFGKAGQFLKLFLKKRRVFLLSLLLAFFLSDLLLLESYKFLLPEKTLPPAPLPPPSDSRKMGRNFYQSLWAANIFHTGPLPGALAREEEKPVSSDPVKSSLPFELRGLIIHANPARSVASIQDKKGHTSSYSEGDSIERNGAALAKITDIERDRVIFLNLRENSRREYILMPSENSLSIAYEEPAKNQPPPLGASLVKREGNRMTVNRSDVEEYLKRFSEIVREAGVVPHLVDGQVEGYRITYIKKGSVFEDLGFRRGDILKKVDGETVTSPQQGFDLFQKLRDSGSFKIIAERNGKEMEYEYLVNENAPIGEDLF